MHASPFYSTAAAAAVAAAATAASAAQGGGRGSCFELPFRHAAGADAVSGSDGRVGLGAVPQDPSVRRNNFLGSSFSHDGVVSAAGAGVTAPAAAAASGWMKPPRAARQQQQHQQQALLKRRSSMPSLARISPSPIITTAPWPLSHPATGMSPAAGVLDPRHHQQHQAAARERPPEHTSRSPSRVSPQARALQHQVVCGPVLRAERSGGATISRWPPTSSGGDKDHGRPVSIGEDMPHTVPNPTSPHGQQLPPPAPRPVQPRQQNVRQQQQQQQQVRGPTQHHDKNSMNHLWSLIPGSLIPGTLRQRTPDHRHTTDDKRRGYEPDQQQGMSFLPGGKRPRGLVDDAACGRWYPPDVHPPLSDVARRHRARAVARLRARRRALAAASAASSALPKASSLTRFSSSTSNVSTDSSDSSGGGGIAESNDHNSGGGAGADATGSCKKAEASSVEGVTDVSEETSGESRELGKPVKYKHRQIAARSRKRTRGRFVSEKAPAFLSMTELKALHRAERERQQQQEVPATPVVSGVGAR